MFWFAFKIKRAGRRSDFALDFAEVVGVSGEADAGRYGVFCRVDHAGCRLTILVKEWAIENDLAAESATIAFAFLVGLPAIQNFIREY